MFQGNKIISPKIYQQISDESEAINFSMPSDLKTGSFSEVLLHLNPQGTSWK